MALSYRIEQDEDPMDPRTWDQLGVMVCWHRDGLGDRQPEYQEQEALSRGGFPLLERYLRRYHGATVVLPIGLIDHSGMSMYVGGGSHPSDSGGWDSGTVGFIFDTAATRDMTGAPLDSIERQLEGEVEEYDQYLRGDVYGYIVEDENGVHLDSCWGFYGYDECESEAQAALASAEQDIAESEPANGAWVGEAVPA